MGLTEGSAVDRYSFESVRRWTTRKLIDIFDFDRVVVPIHEGAHWSCAVINIENRSFDLYDSLRSEKKNRPCLEALARWLEDESLDKHGVEINLSEWKYTYHKDIPQQTNAHDCGVFAILFAGTVGCGLPIHFTDKHIKYFRRRFIMDILCHGTLKTG
jgi:sentrin-specific protease 1